jgi:signal transduction histidine kinase/ActR/RegA family two-component response regulator
MTEVAREVVSTQNWALRAAETDYLDIKVLVEAFNGMLNECGSRTRELELQHRRKDEFLATLAHELRNPLAPMTSAVALLEMPAAPPVTKANAVAMLARQLRHMVRLIDDLLDASRIATGKLSLETKTVDLFQTLRAAVEVAETEAARRGLSVHLELPERPLCVTGDTVRLSQVFANLLNNACKYTARGGRIDVSANHEGGTIQVDVRDTGIGIEPAMQSRIFELFEQVDKSMERGSAGLGIGLTLTRQLIEMHGGSVSVTSEGLGHGACFRVRLPSVHCQDKAGAHTTRSAADSSRLQILIAEDNIDLAESLAQVLASAGHQFAVVHDGSAALAAATAVVPDVALIDIGMPYNGHLVAQDLRANPVTQRIRLVAMGGWGDASEQAKAQQAGFDRHLIKPVEPQRLLEVLAELFPPRPENAAIPKVF